MFVGIGYILILASVFGGFSMLGGYISALLQPVELVMIGGSAIGAFVVANGGPALKATLEALPTVLKGTPYNRAFYMEMFALMYELLSKARKSGLMSIEGDIERPEASAIFSKYSTLMKHRPVVEFICDYFRLIVGGNLNALEIENLMDVEIDTYHQDGEVPVISVKTIADAMPAFGIVAAVMGVVHTMASVGLPPAELGVLIANALVGTFLGILLAYGFVGPLGTVLEHRLNEATRVYQTIKLIITASLNGYAPQVAVEFGRKVLAWRDRPTFQELETHVKQARAK